MFQKTSTLIDPAIKKLALRYEEPGKQLLLALPVATTIGVYEVNCNVVESKPLQILEEFILRAALEIQPPIHWKQLASVLKVDARFISDTKTQLKRLGAIKGTETLEITEQGERFYRQGALNSEVKVKTWYIVSIPSIYRLIAAESGTDLLEKTEHIILDDGGVFDVDSLTLGEIIDITVGSGLRYHDDSRQITALNSIQHVRNGYLEWGICTFLDWTTGELSTHIVQQPRFKLEASDLKRFHAFVDEEDIIANLLEQGSYQSEDVPRWSSTWNEITNQLSNIYVDEVFAARNHKETILETGSIQRIDHEDFINVFDAYTRKAASVVFLNLDIFSSGHVDLLTSLFADLADRRIITIGVSTNTSLDSKIIETASTTRMLDDIPAVHLLRIHEDVPLALVIDSNSIFVVDFAAVPLRTKAFNVVSLVSTTETAIVSSVVSMLGEVFQGLEGMGLWGQFAAGLLLKWDLTEIVDLLIQQDFSNFGKLMRYWANQDNLEKAQSELSHLLEMLERELGSMTLDQVAVMQPLIRDELFITGNDGELKFSALIDKHTEVLANLSVAG